MASTMRISVIRGIMLVIMLILSGNVFPEEREQTEMRELPRFTNNYRLDEQGRNGSHQENFLIDFSDYSGGAVHGWLESKGFYFKDRIQDNRVIELSAEERALMVTAKQPARVFLINESFTLKKFSKVTIEWGILQYPQDASYEKKVNNEALMVYVFFGDTRLPSGSFFVPDSPYFIGLFLSKEDTINKPYRGRYFNEGGRFVCLGNPKPGETVISKFDLNRAFQDFFNDVAPSISGISLAVDTSSSGNEGKAEAFIKRIEFLGE